MNAKEAREIVNGIRPEFNMNALPPHFYEAKGFLDCYEQVKPLLMELENLLNKMEYVHNHETYFSVWQCAQNHQGKYQGPKYKIEMDSVKESLSLWRKAQGGE